ncbi:MAG: GNAT family N-acetyltransferase [Candidatus Promineifilaceae bacterium]|nr:GNAT family N-acetyltransferase [Candidatus Promineifilaceae bacterium]
MKKFTHLTDDLMATISDEADEHERKIIHEEIKAFNDAVSEYHRLARATGTRALHIIVEDENNRIVAGLIADTYWGWLDIDDLWVTEKYRGKGIGTLLIKAAEEEAKARTCQYSQIKTFSFQARDFYQKCGYKVTGELRDYPPGNSLYWMVKVLR